MRKASRVMAIALVLVLSVASFAFAGTMTDENGTKTTTTQTPDGNGGFDTTIKIDISKATSEQGTAVFASAVDAKAEPTLIFNLPSNKNIKINIPVLNGDENTVIVLPYDDGTEKVIEEFYIDNGYIHLSLNGSVTLKVENRKHEFNDIEKSWAKSSILFVTARDIFSGIYPDTFGPMTAMTRGMLFTVLGRMADAEINAVGPEWFKDGQIWAMENYISDGSDPMGIITREQLITMLYRYDNGKLTKTVESLEGYYDREQVSEYAVEPMKWALGNGLITGYGMGLEPQNYATREQLAGIMERYIKSL